MHSTAGRPAAAAAMSSTPSLSAVQSAVVVKKPVKVKVRSPPPLFYLLLYCYTVVMHCCDCDLGTDCHRFLLFVVPLQVVFKGVHTEYEFDYKEKLEDHMKRLCTHFKIKEEPQVCCVVVRAVDVTALVRRTDCLGLMCVCSLSISVLCVGATRAPPVFD